MYELYKWASNFPQVSLQFDAFLAYWTLNDFKETFSTFLSATHYDRGVECRMRNGRISPENTDLLPG